MGVEFFCEGSALSEIGCYTPKGGIGLEGVADDTRERLVQATRSGLHKGLEDIACVLGHILETSGQQQGCRE